jgi:2-polyprenyl-3-methyl-5-hydroxy-6-metoxy-1,4-benzoquinol methylase
MNETHYACPACDTAAGAEPVELAGYRMYRCPRCGLRFTPEAFHQTVDYDRVYRSAEYESDQVQAIQALDGHQLAQHPTYRAFFEQVRHAAGARLLDVGCGVGRFGLAAHARGWDVTGVDVSELAIATGRALAPFPMRVANIAELADEGERFEVITAFEVLEHLSSPIDFLQEIQCLLKPGGQAFLTVPNWECRTVQTSARPDWLPPIHLLYFNEPALRRTGELSGFTRVSTGTIRADPLPAAPVPQLRWLARRILLRSRELLGLWLHGWLPN